MKIHAKIYLNYFGYCITDFIPCEICGVRANDIHHIQCRGMGGTNKKDDINNLMAVCREHHLQYGDKAQWIEWLKEKHKQFMSRFHK